MHRSYWDRCVRIAILLHKPSCFPNITPYLEQCCQSLYDEGEVSHDKYILHIFQLQVIAEKLNNLSWNHGMELGSKGSAAGLYVSNIKSDLDKLRNQLPLGFYETREYPRNPCNNVSGRLRIALFNHPAVMAMQLYSSELCLYQLSLSQKIPLSSAYSIVSETWWGEIFCSGLTAAENILNMYLGLPLGGEQAFNNTQWVQMAFCILVASRQVVAASSMGKAALLPQIHTWPETLEKLRQRLEALSTDQVDLDGERDVFVDFEKRVSRIQGWFDCNFDNPEGDLPPRSFAERGDAGLDAATGRPYDTSIAPLDVSGLPPLIGDDFQLAADFFIPSSLEMMTDWL